MTTISTPSILDFVEAATSSSTANIIDDMDIIEEQNFIFKEEDDLNEDETDESLSINEYNKDVFQMKNFDEISTELNNDKIDNLPQLTTKTSKIKFKLNNDKYFDNKQQDKIFDEQIDLNYNNTIKSIPIKNITNTIENYLSNYSSVPAKLSNNNNNVNSFETVTITTTNLPSILNRTYLGGMQNNITLLSESTAAKLTKLSSSSLVIKDNLNSIKNNEFINNKNLNISKASNNNNNNNNNNNSNNTNNNNLKNNNNKIIKQLHQHQQQHQQKTDAPMLNYIFDSFSTANKHHHHDQRYGPHFEDIKREGNVTNITVQAGSTVHLNCRISLLQDKTVSWVKRNLNGDEDVLELLTVGVHTYSGDNRYTMEFQYPNNWRLKISNARKSDEGIYECQISTHPPRVIQINLHVNAPKVMIIDEHGLPLQEKYYEIDSTLQLSCIVRNVVMSSSVVYWSHGDQILNYDLTRGGVSVKTELMEHGANSTLFIARINKSDSGNYTCSINSSHEYSIMVHILNGESFAELHHGNSTHIIENIKILYGLIIIIFITRFYHDSILLNSR